MTEPDNEPEVDVDVPGFLGRVQQVLTARGWSARAFCAKARISPAYIGAQVIKAKRGEPVNPGAGYVRALADAAGVSPAWLAGWSSDAGTLAPDEKLLSNQERVCRAAELLGWDAEAIRQTRSRERPPHDNDSIESWLGHVRQLHQMEQVSSAETLTSMPAAQPKKPSEPPPPNPVPPLNTPSAHPASSKTRRRSG